MKFNISPPPDTSGSPSQRIDELYSWLYALTETLNVTLSCLSAENFNSETKELFKNLKERTSNGDNL